MIRNAYERFTPKEPEPSNKEDWEFWWQQTQWLKLWQKSKTQEACKEYWQKFRHLDDIIGIVAPTASTRILDVGCGISSVLHFLPGVRVGVDPLGDRYRSIYRYPFEVLAAPGESLPFEGNAFDAVFCSNCIDHTEHPSEVIREVRRVLCAGGYFVLTCEVFAEDLGSRNVGHPHSMTEESLLSLVGQFTVVRHWISPWYGMRDYALGRGPTAQNEHILVLRR